LTNIAFIAPYSWIGISNPLINSAIFLADLCHQIDIFTVYNKTNEQRGINNYNFNNKKINVFTLKRNVFQKIKSKFDGKIHSHFISRIDATLYNLIIAFDLDGLRIASDISKLIKVKYIYFSLEIEDKQQIFSKDQYSAQNAILTITQSELRKKVISNLYKIPKKRIYTLPNSCFGPIIDNDSSYFSNLFKLNNKVKIILCIGTLHEDTCIDKIIESITNLSENYCLVLHGWFAGDKIKNIFINYKRKYPNRIFHSDKILHDNKIIYESCDFGIIAYNPITDNLKYVMGASGKMFEFLKYGVPLISNNIPLAKEMIEDSGCGLVVNNFNEISQVLDTINNDYNTYKINCHNQFSYYEFSNQISKLYKNKISKELNN